MTLLAPIQRPPRIFGIGLSYREHAAESKMVVQSVPTVFLKLSSTVVGADADVILAPEATQPDYEVELGVVIGKAGYRIPAEAWEEYVLGYTIVNDVSARGVQLATTQGTLGKSFPTFTPLGPSVVTRDEVPDPHALDIKLTLAGEVMQSANTRDPDLPYTRTDRVHLLYHAARAGRRDQHGHTAGCRPGPHASALAAAR